MALGNDFSGFLVSAAVVPTNSIPKKANTAIWNPAKKPVTPCGKNASGSVICEKDALTPFGDTKPITTKLIPKIKKATIATILIMANQNSVSPNIFTVSKFNTVKMVMVAKAGIHTGKSGYQNCM